MLMNRSSRSINMRIPADLYSEIESMARQEQRPIANMATYLLTLAVRYRLFLFEQVAHDSQRKTLDSV